MKSLQPTCQTREDLQLLYSAGSCHGRVQLAAKKTLQIHFVPRLARPPDTVILQSWVVSSEVWMAWMGWDDVFKGWIGVSPLKKSFLGEQKEWEKRQKVDKNLELGGFLGGRSDFLLMFFVDIFTTDVAEPFFCWTKILPKKKNWPRKPAAKPRRHEKFWEWATPLEFHEKHRWMFPKIVGFTPKS